SGTPTCVAGNARPAPISIHEAAMSDWLPDSPMVARSYCPDCEPDADPCKEILDTRWCDRHTPARDGRDDDAVAAASYMSGSAEAGDWSNRAMCEFIHRHTFLKGDPA